MYSQNISQALSWLITWVIPTVMCIVSVDSDSMHTEQPTTSSDILIAEQSVSYWVYVIKIAT